MSVFTHPISLCFKLRRQLSSSRSVLNEACNLRFTVVMPPPLNHVCCSASNALRNICGQTDLLGEHNLFNKHVDLSAEDREAKIRATKQKLIPEGARVQAIRDHMAVDVNKQLDKRKDDNDQALEDFNEFAKNAAKLQQMSDLEDTVEGRMSREATRREQNKANGASVRDAVDKFASERRAAEIPDRDPQFVPEFPPAVEDLNTPVRFQSLEEGKSKQQQAAEEAARPAASFQEAYRSYLAEPKELQDPMAALRRAFEQYRDRYFKRGYGTPTWYTALVEENARQATLIRAQDAAEAAVKEDKVKAKARRSEDELLEGGQSPYASVLTDNYAKVALQEDQANASRKKKVEAKRAQAESAWEQEQESERNYRAELRARRHP